MKTLFDKKIDHDCSYCEYGELIQESSMINCNKKGIIDGLEPCWRFKYSPLKRIPKTTSSINIEHFSAEDFSLD